MMEWNGQDQHTHQEEKDEAHHLHAKLSSGAATHLDRNLHGTFLRV